MQEASRREKRRLLDAQRGKCRVRLGSHLDEWCALKDHLGFSLHSQLAKFLLDSYRTSAGPGAPAPERISLLSVSVPSLHRLAFLCQQHGRKCNSFPTILPRPSSVVAPGPAALLWGCKEDHQFYWDPHDYTAGLGGHHTEEDVTGPSLVPPDRTAGSEDPTEAAEEGPEVILQGTVLEPHGAALQSRRVTCPETSPDRVHIQCDGAETVTRHVTAGSQWPPKTPAPEVTDEVLCQGGGPEMPLPSAEVGGAEDGDTRPQNVEASEDTQESISKDPAEKEPETVSSDEECERQKNPKQLSGSYHQALMSEPQAALSFTCRRSPRGSKGCRMKADGKVQGSVSKAPLRRVGGVSSGLKGRDDEELPASTPNTNPSHAMSPVQESSTGTITRQKRPSEGLATLAQKEPSSAEPHSVEMPKTHEERLQNTQMDPHEEKSQEPQSGQCRGQKAGRRKSLIDEELAQICKKRIRKATAQELLMCEYDDCGKIFSKRQYLNYHQKYQHMNQRTFRCSVTECGKTFNFKKHLKEHEKRHSDRRDFICEFCARAFRSSSNLIIHRRIHTGEKPLQCEFCGFTCRQKASLNWHMKKHDADSSYKFPCDICGQRFEKRDNLAAHKSRKHPPPREAGPQEPSPCVTSSVGDFCQLEASCKDDSTESVTEDQGIPTAAAPEGGKGTLFPEYLDLTNSMQEVSQQSAPTPGNPEISLVIVL